jgi:hypothetical protein
MADTWFTSDFHFVYFNIVRYCNRPFASTEEMEDGLRSALGRTGRAHQRGYSAARGALGDRRSPRQRRPHSHCGIPMWVKLCREKGGDLEQIKFLLGHASIQTTER